MIEIETIIDLYDEVEEEVDGKMVTDTKLIKEDLVSRRLTHLEGLFPSEMFKSDGTIYKDRVRVYDDTLKESYIMNVSYDSLKKRVLGEEKKMGFK